MAGFFKNIGKGVLYVLSFPFIVAAIAIAAIAGVFIFIYQFFKIIVLFFAGRSIFKPLDEDIKAQAILNGPQQNQDDSSKQDPLGDYQVYTTGSFTNTAPSSDDSENNGGDDND